jgi:hypothetical protein
MTCAHYWLVDDVAVNGVCLSRCRLCGSTKQLDDYIRPDFRRYPERHDVYVQRLQTKRPAASAAYYENT